MIKIDDEEKRKRYEKAQALTRSVSDSTSNFNNIVLNNYTGKTDDEMEYINRFNRARDLTNAINPRENIPAPTLNNDEIKESATVRDFLLNELNKNNSLRQNKSNDNMKNVKIDTTNSSTLQEAPDNQKKWYQNFFKSSSAFDDGYQFGDITKTGLSTIADAGAGIIKGLASVGEGAGKLLANGIAQVAEWVGDKENADRIRKNTATKEAPISAGISNLQNNYIDNNSVLGKTSDVVMEGIGYSAGFAATEFLTGGTAGSVVMFSSAAGHASSEVYQKENVESWQAWTRIIGSGLIEMTTERLFGLFGKTGLDERVANTVAKQFTSGATKTLARLGITATSEAAEEVIAYIGGQALDSVIDKISDTTGNNGARFKEDWNWEELGEAAVTAAISAGFSGSAMTLSNIEQIKANNNMTIKEAINELAYSQDAAAYKEELYNKIDKINTKLSTENNQQNIEKLQFQKELIEAKLYEEEPLYIAKYNEDGELKSLSSTYGKLIENPNSELNIQPAIVKNGDTYNIIDANNGIELDSTPYITFNEAEKGFNNIANNLSDVQINSINKKMNEANITMQSKMNELVQEYNTQSNQTQNSTQIDNTEQNNIQDNKINNQENKIAQNGFSEQIDNNENEIKNKSFEDIVFDAMQNTNIKETESPLNNRNIETIGKQTNVNAYQYDNPEVKPYFQEMAQMIGEDLSYISSPENRSSVKGGGTKLNTTTQAIKTLHDDMGYSYNDIAKGLQNIIEDNGQENNAVSKKLELIIDDQLRNGYRNALGNNVSPNQDYINAINNKKNIKEIDSKEIKHTTSTRERAFTSEIDKFKKLSENKNIIKNNILEINVNVLDGISKKKQRSFMNEYLRDEIQGKDFFKGTEKIIATGTTTGKLNKGKTNFDKRIDNSLRFEIKSNIIANMDKIIEISEITQGDRIDTKNHTFADTFDRRNSLFTYKGRKMEVMFETGKKNNVSTLYGIENIKITNKNRLSLPKLATQSGLQNTKNGMRVS